MQDPADLETAYHALVREGTTADQEALLNEMLLRLLWPELMLPERCRRTWEDRLPGLAAHEQVMSQENAASPIVVRSSDNARLWLGEIGPAGFAFTARLGQSCRVVVPNQRIGHESSPEIVDASWQTVTVGST